MNETKLSVRDGGNYEHLMLAETKNWPAIIALEKRIATRNDASAEWLTPWVVRGRNLIRKKRGLELIHC